MASFESFVGCVCVCKSTAKVTRLVSEKKSFLQRTHVEFNETKIHKWSFLLCTFQSRSYEVFTSVFSVDKPTRCLRDNGWL